MRIILGDVYVFDLYEIERKHQNIDLVKVVTKWDAKLEQYYSSPNIATAEDRYVCINLNNGETLVCVRSSLSDAKECIEYYNRCKTSRAKKAANFFNLKNNDAIPNTYFKKSDIEELDDTIDELLDTRLFDRINYIRQLKERISMYLTETTYKWPCPWVRSLTWPISLLPQ